MSRARKFWIVGILAGLVLLPAGAVFWLVGTESGVRWLASQAQAVVPEQLELGDVRGTLLRGIRFAAIVWHDASMRVAAADVALEVELLPMISRRLRLENLDVGKMDVELIARDDRPAAESLPTVSLPIEVSILDATIRDLSIRDGQLRRVIDSIHLVASMRGSDLDITRLDLRSTWLNLELAGRLTVADAYPGEIHADWQFIGADDTEFAGELDASGDVERYDFWHSLTAPLAMRSVGHVAYDAGRLFADFSSEWQALEWLVAERRIRSETGSIRLRGTVPEFAVTLQARAAIDDLPALDIALRGDADPQRIDNARLELVSASGNLVATGSAAWVPAPNAQAEIELQWNVADPNLPTGPMRASGNVRYANATIVVADGRISAGENNARFTGALGETIALDADFRLPEIAALLPAARGVLSGRLAISGSRERPAISVQADGTGLAWREYSVGTLRVKAQIPESATGHAEFELTSIGIGDISLESARLVASGSSDKHRVTLALHGYDMSLDAAAAGGYAARRWDGLLESVAVSGTALGSWSSQAPGDLALSLDEAALAPLCLARETGDGNGCVSGNYHRDGAASFDVSLTGLPLAALPIVPPGATDIGGSVTARLRGGLDGRRVTADGNLELLDASLTTEYDGETMTAAFSAADGRLTIVDNRLEAEGRAELADGSGVGTASLLIADIAERESPIEGHGKVALSEAVLFAVLIPGVTNPRGSFEGEMTVSGNLQRPEFAGELALTDGAFGVRQAGIQVADVDLRLRQLAPGRLQLVGTARSGEGRISVDGSTQIGADTGIRTELALTGENFELLRLPDWRIAASPSLTIVLDERAATIAGELVLPAASITLKTVPETAESPSPDAVVHRPGAAAEPAGRRIDIGVRTVLGDDVRFSGFGLTTGISGSVNIRGGTHVPYAGGGRLSLYDGRYKAYGQQLEIERGELIFNGPLDNPGLDIRAIRRAGEVVAGVQLSGTPYDLRSSVFSEPPLSDAEALSYLLTGRPLSSATTAGEGDVLNQAAFALGLSGAGAVASRIRGQMGLDTLAVEGGAASGRIVAGKRFGNRLLVEYGYGLIDKLGTLLLRYQLNDRLVLESRTGTVSNLDIVYSVRKQ